MYTHNTTMPKHFLRVKNKRKKTLWIIFSYLKRSTQNNKRKKTEIYSYIL